MDAETQFHRMVRTIVEQVLSKRDRGPAHRLATISAVDGSGHASVKFDGETNPTTKYYRHNANYTPVVGDRVLMEVINNGWVIAYKIA